MGIDCAVCTHCGRAYICSGDEFQCSCGSIWCRGRYVLCQPEALRCRLCPCIHSFEESRITSDSDIGDVKPSLSEYKQQTEACADTACLCNNHVCELYVVCEDCETKLPPPPVVQCRFCNDQQLDVTELHLRCSSCDEPMCSECYTKDGAVGCESICQPCAVESAAEETALELEEAAFTVVSPKKRSHWDIGIIDTSLCKRHHTGM